MIAVAQLQALIFDVDGTLADTEMAHLAAFNHAFAEVGLAWHWDVLLYRRLLSVAGGRERVTHYWRNLPAAERTLDDEGLTHILPRIEAIKAHAYRASVEAGQVAMRPGVLSLIEEAKGLDVRLAIATTTSPSNVSALLTSALGAQWSGYFDVVEDAGTAQRKKPHPQVYLQALARLGLPAGECLALEDSANGLQAAAAADLAVVITPNDFTAHHDFSGALRVLPDLAGVTVAALRDWHTAAPASAASG